MARPREFDRDDALIKAMREFWEHGYDATSISLLTTAMGISHPSLYAAFGDKKQIFDEAVACYEAGPNAVVQRALSAATADEVVEQMLAFAVQEYTRPGNPRGCMVIADPMCIEQRHRCRADIATRLRRAVKEADLPAGCSPKALANLLFGILTGLSTYARDGATRRQLQDVADVARTMWISRTLQV
jgi:AcrR family transcriptional regulator